MLLKELVWTPDNNPTDYRYGDPGKADRFRSQRLVPVKGAIWPYEHAQYWVVKRVPPHTRAGKWTVRQSEFHQRRGRESGHMDEFEVAVFIAELEPAPEPGWWRRLLSRVRGWLR